MPTRTTSLTTIPSAILLALLLTQTAFAQAGGLGTGPGGVGSTDGTSSLKLWLKADAGVATDVGCTAPATHAASVACWADQSGRGNSFVQSATASRPTFYASGLNGQPVLQFNGTSQYLDKAYTADLNSNNFTLYLVTHATGGGGTYRAPYASRCGTTDATRSGHNFYASSGNLWEFWVLWLRNPPLAPIWSIASGPTTADSAWHILAGLYDYSALWQGLSVDGTILSPQTGIVLRANAACPTRIGAGGTEATAGAFFSGDIAEVAFFDVYLNDAQRTLVDNYLAAKYNLAISNDKFTGNDAAYIRDVAGIGKEFDGYSDQGHSAGMIIRNGSFLRETGDYILIGHAALANGYTAADLPTSGSGWGDGDEARWTRVWYLSKTDISSNGGPVGIDFDFGEAGVTGSPSGSAGNYRLLKRSGVSGQFVEVAQATSIAGDRATFDNVDSTLLGSYFTLATVDSNSSPLAVDLAVFSAQQDGHAVRLDWETTSELDNLGFNVYRGDAIGSQPALLAFVPSQAPGGGAGAIYSYQDCTAVAGGTYRYWLDAVDLAGVATRHGPIEVTVRTPTVVDLAEVSARPAGGPVVQLWTGAVAACLKALGVIHGLENSH